MASNTNTNATRTARKGTTATRTARKGTTATSTAPHGTTSTTVAGTPASQVPHLAHALAALASAGHPVTLAQPAAAWPGWGKGVRVQGNGWQGTAYANRGNIDVRVPVAVAAAVAAAVAGATVRGPGANYVRLPYSATGTPQA